MNECSFEMSGIKISFGKGNVLRHITPAVPALVKPLEVLPVYGSQLSMRGDFRLSTEEAMHCLEETD